MRAATKLKRTGRALCVSAIAMAVTAAPALSGGFDVREQSALFQGMSFAGAAAGGTALSSMFWNPAAAGYVSDGITIDSSYSLIIPRAEVTAERLNGGALPPGLDTSVDFGRDALVPASYAAYRYSDDLVFAVSMNSQFGLTTKPDSFAWAGDILGRTSKVFSINAVPTVAYKIAPGIQIGAGLQVQYLEIKAFKTAFPAPGAAGTSNLTGDDIGVGYTLGVNLTPAPGTSIGLGFRSSIRHDLEGDFKVPGAVAPITADLELPEKLTLGIRQDLAPGIRAHATVEWTNWSRLGVIPIAGAAPIALDFQWDDGWYFALGGEYDYSDKLTLRTGFGYEISPIQDPSQRLVQLPDNDRYWLSAGASYELGDFMGLLKDANVDFAYTHIFVEEGDFSRRPANGAPATFTGSTDSAVDIISIGIRSKL
jgi:long-chain fatty acid transport protein